MKVRRHRKPVAVVVYWFDEEYAHMKPMMKKTVASSSGKQDVDAYIARVSAPARKMLISIRSTIKKAVPQAAEKISYSMPYFGYHGRLAYYSAFTKHVSFFAMMSAATRLRFAKQLKPYQTGKATLQFPIGSKVPVRLIAELVKARAKEAEQAR